MAYTIDGARQVLSRTPDTLTALLAGISDEWLHAREAAGAWSPYEVCGHLLHIEQNDWIDRTRVILTHGGDHTFEPVDREAGFARFAGWSATDLVSALTDARQASLDELDRLVTTLGSSTTRATPGVRLGHAEPVARNLGRTRPQPCASSGEDDGEALHLRCGPVARLLADPRPALETIC